MQVRDNKLQLGGIPAESLAREYGTPLYVYEDDVIKRRYADLCESIAHRPLQIHYACKANSNVHLLALLRAQGANIETVSPGEISLAFKAGFAAQQVIHTCSNMSEQELQFLVEHQILANLDSLSQVNRYGQLSPGASVSLRINTDLGAGHHAHVVTGGPGSKFGIHTSQLEQAKETAAKHGLRIVGVHQHIGSNILEESVLIEAMRALLTTAWSFPELEFVDFGGGLGVPYRHEDKRLDVASFGQQASRLFAEFCQAYGRQLKLLLEPGRYLVAEAGTLLALVTEIKRTPFQTFVGVDTGFNHLIRPAMYGAYHAMVNASCVQGPVETVSIAGNLCESGDLLARERRMAQCREGDVLAILNSGAYGYAMSSNYNARPRPAEVLVGAGLATLIRRREESA
ncbi:MAG: diaminopimelate decarboxylase [Chloroflexi bacterium]|nr:diaminopimelate decarboxylase [Chloroflexota bacterium]